MCRAALGLADTARPTEPNILGPFYRTAAPFRGKICPPLAEGTTLLVAGRVWSFETKRPLRGATLDLWQADTHGRYDNDDPQNPPRPESFANRARVVTDERGYYEYETIHPSRYLNGPKFRPAHVHYRVSYPGHRELVTQLYFEGDPKIPGDPFVRKSLVISLKEVKVAGGTYEAGTFDVVLAKA